MHPGDVLEDRFVLQRHVATGGMSQLYLGRELAGNAPVAIKIATPSSNEAVLRFVREATLLAELSHPGIVRYVAHGKTSASHYLIMEWLDGEDLGRSLRNHAKTRADTSVELQEPDTANAPTAVFDTFTMATQVSRPRPGPVHAPRISALPVSLEEIIFFGRRLASAVAELHRRGVIHRDIKPANLFLPSGSLTHVKLIDLGIARPTRSHRQLTEPGALLGTPHYMAPEQIVTNRALVPATDVWAIGCVLYQLLTGMPPFDGVELTAVLASVLMSDPAPLQLVRSDIPPALAATVMRALAKDPAKRQPDAAALAAELTALVSVSPAAPDSARELDPSPPTLGSLVRATPEGMTHGERHLACTLFVRPAHALAPERAQALDKLMQARSGSVQHLANGILVVTLREPALPGDRAAMTARLALAVRGELPDAAMALITGYTEHARISEALADTAAQLLAHAAGGDIYLDELTAALVDARFHIQRDPTGARLERERGRETARTLLGKPSKWVGRSRELATLTAAFTQCVDEELAQVVLVTAPAGMGKSRLRLELISELRRQGQSFQLLCGAGDMLAAGAPFLLLAQALRALADITGDEPMDAQLGKLRRRLGGMLPAAELPEIIPYLGIMLSITADTDSHYDPALADPVVTSEHMHAALERWLRAESERVPLLIVLDDLHWGDLSSILYIDHALEALANRPMLVLALARPEVRDVFPNLWSKHTVLDMPLVGLSPKASAAMVRAALDDRGAPVPESLVAEIVARADGNAFYLEELIRAVAEGQRTALPDTVLGMVEARLDALDPEAKRILRAASIFGEVFWQGGVEALLGTSGVFEVSEWLEELVSREVIKRLPTSRLPGQIEYAFRHALVRDAAYCMLTEEDRRIGHTAAAGWLESSGAADEPSLAEHLLRSGDCGQAVERLYRAAEKALASGTFDAVLEHVNRALQAGATGELAGKLHLLRTTVLYWRSHYKQARASGERALELLPRGNPHWFHALGHTLVSTFRSNYSERGSELIALAERTPPVSGAESERASAICRAGTQIVLMGAVRAHRQLIDELCILTDAGEPLPPLLEAQAYDFRAMLAGHEGDNPSALKYLDRSVAAFVSIGDVPNILIGRASIARIHINLGDYERGIAMCEQLIAESAQRKLERPMLFTQANMAVGLGLRPELLHEGIELLRSCRIRYRKLNHHSRGEGLTLLYQGNLELYAGQPESALQNATIASEILASMGAVMALVRATRARALVALGRTGEALAEAEHAMQQFIRAGGSMHTHIPMPLALAEARHAAGDHAGACAAIRHARALVQGMLDRLEDADRRAMYLRVPDHQLVMQLAEEWLG